MPSTSLRRLVEGRRQASSSKARILCAEASFLSALVRKRSICPQSTLCGFSFFICGYEQNAFIVPDVFEERIFAGPARVEFFPSQNCIVDLPAELPLKLPRDFR